MGINPATAITCVKPSGTVSKLVNSSSGIHPRISSFYINSIVGSSDDPITKLMIDQEVPYDYDDEKDEYYFHFPIKSPDSSIEAEVACSGGACERI